MLARFCSQKGVLVVTPIVVVADCGGELLSCQFFDLVARFDLAEFGGRFWQIGIDAKILYVAANDCIGRMSAWPGQGVYLLPRHDRWRLPAGADGLVWQPREI